MTNERGVVERLLEREGDSEITETVSSYVATSERSGVLCASLSDLW